MTWAIACACSAASATGTGGTTTRTAASTAARRLVDLEAAYTFTNALTLVVGAQNVFDQYPEENPSAAAGVGNRYSQYTPFGFNGASGTRG